MKERILNPYFALFVGVVAVSASAIFVKLADAPAAVTAFYRMFFSVLIMAPLFFIKYRTELSKISKKDWIYSSTAGVFLAFHFIIWFESLNYTSVASSVVLVTLQPLFAFLGTFLFFKEKVSIFSILSGIIAILGSVLISWGDFRISGSALFGDFLAIVACMMVTAYLLIGQDIRKRLSLITYTFVVYSFSTITIFLYVVLLKYPLGSYSQSTWMYFLLLAIIPNLLGHSLFNWSLKWISTSTISMSILFEPIGAIILAYYILNEIPLWTQITGGIIVLIGISLYALSERFEKLKMKDTINV